MQSHLQWQQKSWGGGGRLFAAIFTKITNTEETELCAAVTAKNKKKLEHRKQILYAAVTAEIRNMENKFCV